MNTIHTAVVGVGALGRHHARWLGQLPQARLVGVYDLNSERAAAVAAEVGCPVLDSLEAVIAQAQAVSIAVPTQAHFDIASRFIEAGKHCLIEKPIAARTDQATELRRLARRHKVKVTVGQIERFNPAVSAIREMNLRPSFIEAHRLAAFDPRGTDVAVVLDLMIHDIDLALAFIKSPVADIQASAVAVISEQADIANARLTFENGAVANLTASRISLRAMRKLRMFQRSGYVSLDLAARQADVYQMADSSAPSEGMRVPLGKSGKEITYRKLGDPSQDQLAAELGAFLDAVQSDKPVAVSLDEAVESLRVALEIDRIGTSAISQVLADAHE